MSDTSVVESNSKRPRYTEAFKTEAIRLVQESKRPLAAVARELNISDSALYRWVTLN